MTRAAIVSKESSWTRLVETAEDPNILALLEKSDPSVARIKGAHEAHMRAANELDEALRKHRIEVVRRVGVHQPFPTKGVDIVITLGGDGTLLSASHQVSNIPILGINSAPAYSIGFFCGAAEGNIDKVLSQFQKGSLKEVQLTRMEVRKNRKLISRRVLNDALFCHASPAATSRYILEFGAKSEEQKSSGFWIGPAAGSTAAQRSAGGKVLPLDSEDLQLVVREPYNPYGDKKLDIRKRIIERGTALKVRSKMQDGKLFLDGPHECVDVGFGDELRFLASNEPLRVLALSRKRRGTFHGPSASIPQAPSSRRVRQRSQGRKSGPVDPK